MRTRLVAASSALLLLLSACSGKDDGPEPQTAVVQGKVSPLTGLKQDSRPDNPVYMVKIENTHGGEPQYGLNHADLVVEELVEFEVTRIAAFFYSDLPTKVGHVRSTRTTDIGLAKPVAATIVASGGDDEPLKAVKDANVPIYTYDNDAPGWSKDPGKVAPYHVLWNLQTLNETAEHTTPPDKGYFVWGSGPAADDVTKTTTHASVKFTSQSTTGWTFTGGKWVRTPERSAPGENFKADTMITIFAAVTDAGYKAQGGADVPELVLKGSGRAVIFSGDQAIEATWHKAGLDGSMTFTAKKTGKEVTLKPGRVWIEAAPRGGSIKY